VIQVLRDGQRHDAGVGLVDGGAREGLLVGGHGGGGNGVEDVDVTSLEVVVGGIHRVVEDEGHAPVLGLLVADVVLVGDEGDLDVVLPRVVGGQLVGAVADRLLAAGLGVVEGRVGQRRVGGVAEAADEVVAGLLQLDREGVVVDDLDAGQLADAFLIGAFEGVEEGGLLLVLGGDEVPGSSEVLGLDGGAVGELAVLVELDGPQGVVFVDDTDATNKRLSISMRAVRNVAAAAVFLTAVFLVAFPGSNRNGIADKQQIKSGVLYNIFDSDDTSNTYKQLDALISNSHPMGVKRQEDATTVASHYWSIVMASHITESNARAFVAKLKKNGLTDARVYDGPESIKVLYGYFSSPKEATERMKVINKTTEFKEAWVIEIGK